MGPAEGSAGAWDVRMWGGGAAPVDGFEIDVIHQPARRSAELEFPPSRFAPGSPRSLNLRLRFAGALLLAAVGWLVPRAAFAFDHLLISEWANTPSAGEFVEVFNPTGETISLSEYFLSDHVSAVTNYWDITQGSPSVDAFDFVARFPEGAVILPGQSVVVSMASATEFSASWGGSATADFELRGDTSTPNMVDAGSFYHGSPTIGTNESLLTNGSEIVVLFRWDGESNLVSDVDMIQWGSGPASASIAPDKTGVTVGGEAYRPDTPSASQDKIPPHAFGDSAQRLNFREGGETFVDGNGITGHDETSEDYSDTWVFSAAPSIGSPGPFGPPVLEGAGALGEKRVVLGFTRSVDRTDAEDLSSYELSEIVTPGGSGIVTVWPVFRATLADDGESVELEVASLRRGGTYEVRIIGEIASEDQLGTVPRNNRAIFRGFDDGPEVALTVPARPFVPSVDVQITFSYQVPQGQEVFLRIFDHQGRKLIENQEISPLGGKRVITWDGRDRLRQRLPAGVYYVSVESGGRRSVKPLVIAAAGGGDR